MLSYFYLEGLYLDNVVIYFYHVILYIYLVVYLYHEVLYFYLVVYLYNDIFYFYHVVMHFYLNFLYIYNVVIFQDKPVQIRPWKLSDADFVLDASLPLDPRKTVFVGGVPRPLKAGNLPTIIMYCSF